MSDTDREWEAELDEDFDAPPPGADIFARPSAMSDAGAVERAAEAMSPALMAAGVLPNSRQGRRIIRAAALAAAMPSVEVAESLPIPGGPKMLRETLCTAQAAIYRATGTGDRDDEHAARLQALIDALDVMRPLGPDGKHGDRHTPWCGCDEQVVALGGA